MHTLNVNNLMKVSNIKCKLKHYISTMVICGCYMFEFNVNKDTKEKHDKKKNYNIYFNTNGQELEN
jgi:hypothetical protein